MNQKPATLAQKKKVYQEFLRITSRKMALDNCKRFFVINKETISCKIACFLSSAYIGSLIPFLNVFFVSVGMTEFQSGILTALVYTPCIVTGPMFGYLADYTNRRRLIFIGMCIAAAATVCSLPWVARVLQSTPSLGDNVTETSSSRHNNISINSTTCEGLSTTKTSNDELFGVLFAVVFVAAIFVFPLMSFLEATVANVSAMFGSSFGAQRIFGEIGISVSSFGTGAACDHFDVKNMSEYSPAFFIFPIICILMVPVGCHLIGQADCYSKETTGQHEGIHTPDRKERNVLKKTIRLCFRSDVLVFLFTVFIGGISNSLYLNFTLKYLVDKMNRTKAEFSYVVICTSVVSCITFPLTSRLLDVLRGAIPALSVALLIKFVRLLIVSYDISFAVFVGIHLLNGFAFALFYSATVEHVRRISPPDINMTMNNITLGLFFYVSALVCNMAGSELYEMFGGAVLFRVQSFVCAVWAIVAFVYYKYTNRNGMEIIRSCEVS